jgi:hypothetical protein
MCGWLVFMKPTIWVVFNLKGCQKMLSGVDDLAKFHLKLRRSV